MHLPFLSLLLLFSTLTSALLSSSSSSYSSCKTLPDDALYPPPIAWKTLSAELSTPLITYTPPAAPCYASHPSYNATLCTSRLPQILSQAFVQSDPGAIRAAWYSNSTYVCPPSSFSSSNSSTTGASGDCAQGYYPNYVVAAKTNADISKAVSFARRWNLRLNVKNTGHDFLGRSIARGALSIWLHDWKKFEHLPAFSTGCDDDDDGGAEVFNAVQVTGGMQWGETYKAAYNVGRLVVGGASGTVGVLGGYLQGGGHGPVSSQYGLAVDQVLQFTAILPSTGSIVTVNACNYPSLFFALRGGGGGTYAVVTQAVLKSYPVPQSFATGSLTLTSLGDSIDSIDSSNTTTSSSSSSSSSAATNTTTASTSVFWTAVARIHAALPALSAAGISGYYYQLPRATTTGLRVLSFSWNMPSHSAATARKAFAPLETRLREVNASFTFSANDTGYAELVNRYLADNGVGTTPPAVGGSVGGTVMWSRLLPAQVMTMGDDDDDDDDDDDEQEERWGAAVRAVGGGEPGLTLLGHLVAGGEVAKYDSEKSGEVGLNPAWRGALGHMIVMDSFPAGWSKVQVEELRVEMRDRARPFRDATPGGGAYVNECDLKEENRYETFFGSNWKRLLQIKRQYDPSGMLYCGNCIGSEDWTEVDGRLCRK